MTSSDYYSEEAYQFEIESAPTFILIQHREYCLYSPALNMSGLSQFVYDGCPRSALHNVPSDKYIAEKALYLLTVYAGYATGIMDYIGLSLLRTEAKQVLFVLLLLVPLIFAAFSLKIIQVCVPFNSTAGYVRPEREETEPASEDEEDSQAPAEKHGRTPGSPQGSMHQPSPRRGDVQPANQATPIVHRTPDVKTEEKKQSPP